MKKIIFAGVVAFVLGAGVAWAATPSPSNEPRRAGGRLNGVGLDGSHVAR